MKIYNKTIAISLFGLACAFLLQACGGNGVDLSAKEASSIINTHENLPKTIWYHTGRINGNYPGYKKPFLFISKLVDEGYAVNSGKIDGSDVLFEITEKGKPLFESLVWENGIEAWRAAVNTHQITLKEVKEVLIDKETKAAEVTAVFQEKLTSEFNNSKAEFGLSDEYALEKPNFEIKYKMKKWDQGWRVESASRPLVLEK